MDKIVNLKALIIDDDQTVSQYFAQVLKAAGFSTRIADNGKSGLLLFEEEIPDIITVDLRMPGVPVRTRFENHST